MITVPGRFHEISITTPNLAASVAFYRDLGFTEVETLPVWPHPYAVVSDGAVTLGLHQYKFPSPSITCVDEQLDAARRHVRDTGLALAFDIADPQRFNEFGFRDPGGTMITVLERATHRGLPRAAHDREASRPSRCGRFVAFDLPTTNDEVSGNFWGATPAAGGLPIRWHDAHEDPGARLAFEVHAYADASPDVLVAPEGTRLAIAVAKRSSAAGD